MSKLATDISAFEIKTDASTDTDAEFPSAGTGRVVDYALLLKPRVMSLVLFTGIAGLMLAPGNIDWITALVAIACIAVGAGASGAINMWYDRDIDGYMERTMDRPLPAGRMAPVYALWFGVVLAVISVVVMAVYINMVSAVLLAVTIAFYIFIYTIWLKRRTPQNIVIGGASGALPPMIGWAAVTGSISIESVLLFAIIFLWTPPHFWALALFRSGDYERAGVPMMPVVLGEKHTKTQILAYALIMAPVAVAPAFVGMTSMYGGLILGALSLWFIYHAVRVYRCTGHDAPRRMFRYSILHLFVIFLVLLGDKFAAPYFT
ncbi:MAG: protoheme IX farnesyltransferase [Rhodospirillales bacterium]|nr:protoheme IX farnesyltransferase [Rhodospirillales bacterium]